MTYFSATCARSWLFRGILILSFLTVITGSALGESLTVVRVEEDWEMVVGTPDPTTNAPQAVCVISPVGHVEATHATIVLNHQSLLSYEPGGLQLQIWDGEVPVSDRLFPNAGIMNQQGEIIRWTQSMEISGSFLLFEITNGSSTTWGSFGGQGYLKATVPTTLANLNAYNPAVSVQNSGVSYAANRVESLILKGVRVFLSTEEQLNDTTARIVYARTQ
jgi:hypothetical protein